MITQIIFFTIKDSLENLEPPSLIKASYKYSERYLLKANFFSKKDNFFEKL